MTRRLEIALFAAMAGSTAHSGLAAEVDTWARADLPPLLEFADGRSVRNLADLARRKKEVRRLMCETFCGTLPKAPPVLLGAEVLLEQTKPDGSTRRQVRLTFGTKNKASFEMWVWIPKGKGPFPILLTQPRYYQIPWAEMALKRGYVVGLYPGLCYTHREKAYPGYESVYRTFQREYPEATWSSIATKAWLAGRALDYLVLAFRFCDVRRLSRVRDSRRR